jgi:hypothetical protein
VTIPQPDPPKKPHSHEASPHNWMTSTQAAQHIGVHVNFLRTIPPSELPFYLIARNRRYKKADVEAYIDQRAVTA